MIEQYADDKWRVQCDQCGYRELLGDNRWSKTPNGRIELAELQGFHIGHEGQKDICNGCFEDYLLEQAEKRREYIRRTF